MAVPGHARGLFRPRAAALALRLFARPGHPLLPQLHRGGLFLPGRPVSLFVHQGERPRPDPPARVGEGVSGQGRRSRVPLTAPEGMGRDRGGLLEWPQCNNYHPRISAKLKPAFGDIQWRFGFRQKYNVGFFSLWVGLVG